ncbi:MAG: hypothetical protein Q9198_007936, partial [Flavoplaca austrocitrina]
MSGLSLRSQLAFLGVLAYCAFVIVRWSRQKLQARRLDCKPARTEVPGDYLGLKRIKLRLAAKAAGNLPQFICKSMDEAGVNAHTVSGAFLMNRLVTTRDPQNIKAILSSQESHWGLGTTRVAVIATLIGWNVLTYEGEAWKHSRSMIRPAFNMSPISNMNLFEQHARQLFRQIESHGWDYEKTGWSSRMDLQMFYTCYTLDVATEFVFGYSAHSQNPDARAEYPEIEGKAMPDFDSLGQNLEDTADWLTTIAPLGRWHMIIPNRAFKRNLKNIRTCTRWLVDGAMQGDKSFDRPHSVMDEMRRQTSNATVLENQACGVLFAARATTTSLLAWTTFYLSRQPATYQKLRAAIQDQVGLDADSAIPDMSKLRSCDYLQHCISEGLRLGSPISFVSRTALQDTVLPRGGGADGTAPIFVFKGTPGILNLFAMHHRTDLYGDDVEDFRPERWEKRERDWAMSPFGGGSRICIGQQFALNQVSYVLTRMAQRYDMIENVDPILGP